MTTEDIKRAVAERIKENYPDYDVYTEELEQGFSDRCFFISRITAFKQPKVRNEYAEQYKYTHSFSVTVFSENNKGSLDSIADCLYSALTYITADCQKIRGVNMSHSMVDNSLVFLVDYNTRVAVEDEKIPEMEVLKTDVGKKD